MSPRPSTSSPTRANKHLRHSSMPDTPPHTPTRPAIPYGSSEESARAPYSHPPVPAFLPSKPAQLMTPPLTPPNPQYIPTPASSRPSSPPLPSLTVPLVSETPSRRASTTLSRTPSFASLTNALPTLPIPAKALPLPVGLTKRHRRLTALLVSATLLLCVLGYAVMHLTKGSASLHLLPLDISLLGHSPSTTPVDAVSPVAAAPYAGSHRRPANHRPKPVVVLPPLVLTPEQELAALVAHLASVLDTNSLPAEIDPSMPIDPDYLVGFDTRGPNKETVEMKLQDLVTETWISNPVVVFTKSGPRSREVINILTSYGISPAPLEISLDDSRADARLLRKALARLTAGQLPTSAAGTDDISLPLMLLGGKPLHRTVSHMHVNGELRELLREAGVKMSKNPKGGKRRMVEDEFEEAQ